MNKAALQSLFEYIIKKQFPRVLVPRKIFFNYPYSIMNQKEVIFFAISHNTFKPSPKPP